MLHCPFIDCLSLFGDDEALQKHLKSKHPDRSVRKKFSCHHPSCDYSTDFKWNLKLHMVVHTRVRAFKCNYQSCRKDFNQQSSLNRHIKTVHEKKGKYTCLVCSKEFTQKGDLARHKKAVHNKTKSHVCRYCRRLFVNE